MEILFFVIVSTSILVMLVENPSQIIVCMQNGATKAIDLSFQLLSVYALWLGILELVEKSRLSEILAKIIKPITKILFKNLDEESERLLALNLASNILGMSNASTPSGISAMEKFDKKDGKLNQNMIMLAILNFCAIQVLPTTIIGIRINFQSNSPSDIILPNILSSFLTTIIGILLALFIEKIKGRKKIK